MSASQQPALVPEKEAAKAPDNSSLQDPCVTAQGSSAIPPYRNQTPLSGNTVIEDDDDDYCETPCKHHPISLKYPSSLVLPHANNLHKFIRDVSKALKPSYPRTRDNCDIYDRAHILFLRWKDDDMGTQSDIDELRPLMENLRFTADKDSFTTSQYNIPSESSQFRLEEVLVQKRNEYAMTSSDLLVIYYGGHGRMNKQQRCIWYPWINPPPGSYEPPEIDWTSLQERLQTCDGDVVFILDCCYASSMVRGSHSAWKGFKELLVASGKHERTEGVNNNSFTRALIRELKNLRGKKCSISGLQATMVENQDTHGLMNTPIRIGLSERANRFESLLLVYPEDAEAPAPVEKVDITTLSYGTRVLISIRLRDPAIPVQISEWIPWLKKQAPPDILDLSLSWTHYVCLESGFHHGSTLLFFSMPLNLWNLLPHDSSYTFIDLVKSRNLIKTGESKEPAVLEAIDEAPEPSAVAVRDAKIDGSEDVKGAYIFRPTNALPGPSDHRSSRPGGNYPGHPFIYGLHNNEIFREDHAYLSPTDSPSTHRSYRQAGGGSSSWSYISDNHQSWNHVPSVFTADSGIGMSSHRRLFCPICQKDYQGYATLANHLNHHRNVLMCVECSQDGYLMQDYPIVLWACGFCITGQLYKSKDNLHKHIAKDHSGGDVSPGWDISFVIRNYLGHEGLQGHFQQWLRTTYPHLSNNPPTLVWRRSSNTHNILRYLQAYRHENISHEAAWALVHQICSLKSHAYDGRLVRDNLTSSTVGELTYVVGQSLPHPQATNPIEAAEELPTPDISSVKLF